MASEFMLIANDCFAMSAQGLRRLAEYTLPSSGIYAFLAAEGRKKLMMKGKFAPTEVFVHGGATLSNLSDRDILALFADIAEQQDPKGPIDLYISRGKPYAGPPLTRIVPCTHRVLADATPVDGDAWKQLKATAGLKGMLLACGMPDLHAGGKFPVGAVFISTGVIHPALIGGDIGCGMSLTCLPMSVKYARKPDKLADRLRLIEGPYPFKDASLRAAFLTEHGVSHFLPGGMDASPNFADLGTIGSGNHFCEILQVAELRDPAVAASLNITEDKLLLLTHSGSRTLGQHVLGTVPKHLKSLPAGSKEAQDYTALHDQAVSWARANRALITKRVITALNPDMIDETVHVLDISHNYVEKRTVSAAAWGAEGEREVFIHRKGAASVFDGPVVIPGSRGSHTYVVQPTGDGIVNGFSLAHGAGRAMSRTSAEAEFRKPKYANQMYHTVFGSTVVCEDLKTLYQEAPDAYKQIDLVVQDLVNAGVCKIIAILQPVLTYKHRYSQA